ncbi:MAG: flavin reductase family protein [Alicyclobacillus sp.]|nr:flavin reductase family protein [Alicyclobacillus sp.]
MDGAELRGLMGHFATGVCVLTTDSPSGPYGITVNSLTSLSLQPPLVLFCLDHQVGGFALFQPGVHVGLNVLTNRQSEISRVFARRGVADRFRGVPWREGPHKVPLLGDTLAVLVCQVEATHPGGDHTIFVARVEQGWRDAEAHPLLFYRGSYRTLGQPLDTRGGDAAAPSAAEVAPAVDAAVDAAGAPGLGNLQS